MGAPLQNISNLVQSKSILLGTSNRKKVLEFAGQLEPRGFSVQTPSDFPDGLEVAETGLTFMENARIKAIAQATHRRLWAIGEDSGLCVIGMDGRPGIYSARFSGENATDQSNNRLLLELMESIPENQRQAYYVSTIVLSDPEGGIHIETQGECWGRILTEPRGELGFGYDPLFEIPEFHKTFAELGLSVKRAISHRGRALRAFLSRLDELVR
jgi:XTP/dITP diphosphohydrolase